MESDYLLYLTLALFLSAALTSLADKRLVIDVEKAKFCALLCVFAGVVLGSIGVSSVFRSPVIPLSTLIGIAVLSHGFIRGFRVRHIAVCGVCIVAGCLYLPSTRVPFYDPAGKTLIQDPKLSGRTLRLLDSSEILGAHWEHLWYNDSVMTLFGRKGLSGYDTAMQRSETGIFSLWYSPALRQYIDRTFLLKYGIQSSIAFPDADGILDRDGKLGIVNRARLTFLGADKLLYHQQIRGLPTPQWDSEFGSWSHTLDEASPVNFFRHAEPEQLSLLFSEKASAHTAAMLLQDGERLTVEFDNRTGDYRANLPGRSGLVLIAYNLRAHYDAYVDGRLIEPIAVKNLPFVLLRIPAGGITMELRPRTWPIKTLGCIGVIIGFGYPACRQEVHCSMKLLC